MPQQQILQTPPGIGAPNTMAKFGEKVAALQEFRYDGKTGGVNWHKKMKDYLISKAPEIEVLLHAVESLEDAPAIFKELAVRQSLAATPPAVLQHIGAELWGFLVLCLSGDARCAIDTTDRREGFEV